MKYRTLMPEERKGVVMPITPMLDMTFQLLFFFIINYHPNALEGQMDLSLPAPTENKSKVEIEKPLPSDIHSDDVPAQVKVIVKTQQGTDAEGLISRVTVEELTGATDIEVVSGKLEPLRKHLERIGENVENKKAVLIKADGKLKWGSIVQVMDACRKAGFTDIGFAELPETGES
ncbi:MAG: ExbD/TolR family protein [Gemmataceae bacterium]